MSDTLLLASGADDIRLWTGEYYKDIVKQYQPHAKNISSLAWNYTNSMLVSTSIAGDKICVASREADFQPVSYPLSAEAVSVCWHGSSRVVATGCSDGTARLYDLKQKKVRKSYTGHKSQVLSVKFNHTDTNLATASKSGEVIIHSTVTEVSTKLMTTLKLQAIQDMEYSQCKPVTLATVSDDASLVLWDTNAKRSVHQFARSHKAPATGLSFSPSNDKLLISCGLDKRIVLYDVLSKSIVRNMQVDAPLSSICMHGDGCQIATGTIRGQILIYDLRKSSNLQQSIIAHRSSVQCLAFQHRETRKSSHRDDSSGSIKSSVSAESIKQHSSLPDAAHITYSQTKPHTTLDDARSETNGSMLSNNSTNVFSPDLPVGQNYHNKLPLPPSGLTAASANGTDSVFSPDVIATAAPQIQLLSRHGQSANKSPEEATPLSSRQRTGTGFRQLPTTPAQPLSAMQTNHAAVTFDSSPDTHKNASIEYTTNAKQSAPSDTSLMRRLKEEIKRELKTEIVSDVKDLLDTMKEDLQQTIMDHHYEMVKQFFLQQNHTEAQVAHYSLHHDLLKENEELRAENERLKRLY